MSEPIDLGRFLAIARKRKERGRESLSDDERAYYHQCMRTLRPVFERLAEWANDPTTQAGYAMFEQMSPEDQERFRDWTPAQLYAFKELLEDDAFRKLFEDEPPDEDVWA